MEATWFASFYIALLIFFPLGCELGSNSLVWARALSWSLNPTRIERIAFYMFYLTLLGAWIGAIAFPLDWQRKWQKYPIPLVVGAQVGNGFAGFLSYLL